MTTLIALWRIAKWIRKQKKEMEADVNGFLIKGRAREWRLQSEKIFRALEEGKGDLFNKLPWVIRWFFSATEMDNRFGAFGMYYLKSDKLRTCDKVLEQPLYRTH